MMPHYDLDSETPDAFSPRRNIDRVEQNGVTESSDNSVFSEVIALQI